MPVATFGELVAVGAVPGTWRLKTLAPDNRVVLIDVTPEHFTQFDVSPGMTVMTRGEPIETARGPLKPGSFGVLMNRGRESGDWRFKYFHSDGEPLQIDLAS